MRENRHKRVNAMSTISTQFDKFTTNNMGATEAIKISGNSDDLRTKSTSGSRLEGARRRILGAYRVLAENIVG